MGVVASAKVAATKLAVRKPMTVGVEATPVAMAGNSRGGSKTGGVTKIQVVTVWW